MPFGISSAPEVFQRHMHELIEGLQGVEVIADDFVVFDFANTQAESTGDHDKNLEAFLRRCEERNIRVNAEKVRLRMTKVPFIGHVC